MGYPIVTAQNAIQEHPIASCGDYFYVIFGGAYRDFIDDAHRVLADVVAPAFQQINEQSLRGDISALEAMKAKVTELAPEYRKAQDLVEKMNGVENVMQFQWESWSDLINPLFWLQALAYGVYSVAIKVWNLAGASQKITEMTAVFDQMDHGTNRIQVLVGGHQSDKQQIKVFVSLPNMLVYKTPVMNIKITENEQNKLVLTAERIWQVDGGAPAREWLLMDYSQLTEEGLFVTFDNNNGTEEMLEAQADLAVELMIREGMELVIIQTRFDMDFSHFGFVKYENENLEKVGSHLWMIDQKQVNSFKLRAGEDSEMTWAEYFAQESAHSYFGNMPKELQFFPKGQLLFPLDEPL